MKKNKWRYTLLALALSLVLLVTMAPVLAQETDEPNEAPVQETVTPAASEPEPSAPAPEPAAPQEAEKPVTATNNQENSETGGSDSSAAENSNSTVQSSGTNLQDTDDTAGQNADEGNNANESTGGAPEGTRGTDGSTNDGQGTGGNAEDAQGTDGSTNDGQGTGGNADDVNGDGQVQDDTTDGAGEGEDGADGGEEAQCHEITGFAGLEPASATVNEKPALEEVLAALPALVTARLSDESEIELEVTWSCEDYENAPYGDFTFCAALKDEEYVLAEGVELPKYILTVSDPHINDGDYTYILDENGEALITAWRGTDTALTVPDAFGEHAVTAIDAEVFSGREQLEEIILPAGLKTLGDKALADLKKLKAVSFPDALESMGQDVLTGSDTLEKVTLIVTLESTLTANDTVEHKVIEEEEERLVSVKLPLAVTDLEIRKEGALQLDCTITIDREHNVVVCAEGTLKVSDKGMLTLLGALDNQGTLKDEGIIVNCVGTLTGSAPECIGTGIYITEHDFVDGVCTVCGEKAPEEKPVELTIRYVGNPITKVYDRTSEITLKASDFKIEGEPEGVRITGVSASYDDPAAGERTVHVGFSLGGENASHYRAKAINVKATIQPKTLTITPTAGQSKLYGEKDPSTFKGRGVGLLDGTVTGKLGREEGEDVGTYLYNPGTVTAGGNYTVEVVEAYFTILPKPIDAKDVSVSDIGNQRYTGAPVTPAVKVTYKGQTLVEGTDYTLRYVDNIEPGKATVRITGEGSFTGEVAKTFRILKVSGGSSTSADSSESNATDSGSSGYSSHAHHSGGFGYSGGSYSGGSGSADGDDFDVETLGEILFSELGEPWDFDVSWYEESDGSGQWLAITPWPEMDPETQLPVQLEDGRDRYGKLHLRLSPTALEQIREMGGDDLKGIRYVLDGVSLFVPMENLLDTIDLSTWGRQETHGVEAYDICIEQMTDEMQTSRENAALEGFAPIENGCRIAVTAETVDGDVAADSWPVISQMEGVLLSCPASESKKGAVWAIAATLTATASEADQSQQLPATGDGIEIADEVQVDEAAEGQSQTEQDPLLEGVEWVQAEYVEAEQRIQISPMCNGFYRLCIPLEAD